MDSDDNWIMWALAIAGIIFTPWWVWLPAGGFAYWYYQMGGKDALQ